MADGKFAEIVAHSRGYGVRVGDIDLMTDCSKESCTYAANQINSAFDKAVRKKVVKALKDRPELAFHPDGKLSIIWKDVLYDSLDALRDAIRRISLGKEGKA